MEVQFLAFFHWQIKLSPAYFINISTPLIIFRSMGFVWHMGKDLYDYVYGKNKWEMLLYL